MDKTSRTYKTVKKRADAKFKERSSIYKSAWIVREYKKAGGKWLTPHDPSQGLTRWFKEDWVQIGKDGRATKRPCGSGGPKPLCRPRKRLSKQTPSTIKELGPKRLQKAYRRKRKTPSRHVRI